MFRKQGQAINGVKFIVMAYATHNFEAVLIGKIKHETYLAFL
jgi:hypothetical protein